MNESHKIHPLLLLRDEDGDQDRQKPQACQRRGGDVHDLQLADRRVRLRRPHRPDTRHHDGARRKGAPLSRPSGPHDQLHEPPQPAVAHPAAGPHLVLLHQVDAAEFYRFVFLHKN